MFEDGRSSEPLLRHSTHFFHDIVREDVLFADFPVWRKILNNGGDILRERASQCAKVLDKKYKPYMLVSCMFLKVLDLFERSSAKLALEATASSSGRCLLANLLLSHRSLLLGLALPRFALVDFFFVEAAAGSGNISLARCFLNFF